MVCLKSRLLLATPLALAFAAAAAGQTSVPSMSLAGHSGAASSTATLKSARGRSLRLQPIIIAAKPVPDFDGSQLRDPDGKPMWIPAQVQRLDKKGRPVFSQGEPVFRTAENPGYDARGKHIHAVKLKPVKPVPVLLDGAYFYMDSFVARTSLSRDLSTSVMYFYIPGTGVAIVASQPFDGSTEQRSAFKGNSLDIHADGHTVRLVSDTRLTRKPVSAFVRVDRSFRLAVQNPVFGYGAASARPYAWPEGSRAIQYASR